ncbi:redoxin domain-containing protein (plasmid) [Halorientalis pallida]|uniref:redoxin domain-containing protein n=1 Tax=Halorientalis pallida TaxID=2479928 RepID=UPI003C6EBD05
MLSTGTQAPDFTLPGIESSHDDEIHLYGLSERLSETPVLLNFYLFDFHPACTDNLCDLHDLSWFTVDDSVTVFGVSTDRIFSHREFGQQQHLDLPLLSDSDGSVAESYDVLYQEFNDHKRIAKRAVFVIDTDQVIKYAWSTDEPSDQPDWEPVQEAVKAIV